MDDFKYHVAFLAIYLLPLTIFYWMRTPELPIWRRIACSSHGLVWLLALGLATFADSSPDVQGSALPLFEAAFAVLVTMAVCSNATALYWAREIPLKEQYIAQGLALPFELAAHTLGWAAVSRGPL